MRFYRVLHERIPLVPLIQILHALDGFAEVFGHIHTGVIREWENFAPDFERIIPVAVLHGLFRLRAAFLKSGGGEWHRDEGGEKKPEAAEKGSRIHTASITGDPHFAWAEL